MLSQYEELVQRLEQIVETLGRITSTQEKINELLGEEIDTLARIARREPKNPNP